MSEREEESGREIKKKESQREKYEDHYKGDLIIKT